MQTDEIIVALKRLHWSVGDVVFRGTGGSFTLVTCHRGGQVISVKAKKTEGAWREALTQALKLERVK